MTNTTQLHFPGIEPAPATEVAPEEKPLSAAYLAALEAVRAATRTFDAAQKAYRARQIGDAEFLAARAVFEAAEKDFDRAYALENGEAV